MKKRFKINSDIQITSWIIDASKIANKERCIDKEYYNMNPYNTISNGHSLECLLVTVQPVTFVHVHT